MKQYNKQFINKTFLLYKNLFGTIFSGIFITMAKLKLKKINKK